MIVSPLCWNCSCKAWLERPWHTQCRNIANCSAAETWCIPWRPVAISSRVRSLWNTNFFISISLKNHPSCLPRSLSSHSCPERTDVYWGVFMNSELYQSSAHPRDTVLQTRGLLQVQNPSLSLREWQRHPWAPSVARRWWCHIGKDLLTISNLNMIRLFEIGLHIILLPSTWWESDDKTELHFRGQGAFGKWKHCPMESVFHWEWKMFSTWYHGAQIPTPNGP